MKRDKQGKSIQIILIFCAFISLVIIVVIAGFILKEGYPIFVKYGFLKVLLGTSWKPLSSVYGLWPMIMGTVLVTMGALVLGVPLGLLTAIFLAEFAPGRVSVVIRPAVELLAGIPSVVYGLFGMTIIVPAIRGFVGMFPAYAHNPLLSSGYGIIAGSIILAIMILPTIINISEDAIRSVPLEYKEGSLALGATHWQTVYRVIVPAAGPGITASVVLGMGRAIGETMAIIMVAGNAPIVPSSVFSSFRSMTGNIALEMSYSSGEHTQALFATGIILFIFIMLINSLAIWASGKGVKSA